MKASLRHPDTSAFWVDLEAPADRVDLALRESGLGRIALDWETLHTWRWLIVPASGHRRARLLIDAVHDETPAEFAEGLAKRGGEVLVRFLRGHTTFRDSESVVRWLERHREPTQTLHLGSPGWTVARIRAEVHLRERAEVVLDELRRDPGVRRLAPEAVRRRVRERLSSDDAAPRLDDPRFADRVPTLRERASLTFDMALALISPVSGLLYRDILAWIRRMPPLRRTVFSVGLVLHAFYTVIPSALFLAWIRRLEEREGEPAAVEPSAAHLARVRDTEDHFEVNPLSLCAHVRPSWARRFVLRSLLWGAERGCRHLWTEGELAGIPTIHFARLLQVERGRQFLFLSDYSGSWESYLGDFLGPGSRAVVPLWTHLDGCPPTRWLFLPTPGFAARFLPFTRARQLAASLWYCAYPDLGPREIRANAAFCRDLRAERLSDAEAQRWLRG